MTLQANDERRTLSVEEAALALGIGRGLAYQLARSGQLPVLRLGRKLLVPRAALDRLLGEEPEQDRNDSAPANSQAA